MVDRQIRSYLAQIGRKGGLKSRRVLTSEESHRMLRVREAGRAFRRYHARCFWSFSPNYTIKEKDVLWVAEQLMKHGNRELWLLGKKLCR
jgi:hypothetical protein